MTISYPSDVVFVPVAKIEGYLLNRAQKHYSFFEKLGYKSGDGAKLFKLLESQFNKNKAMMLSMGQTFPNIALT